MLEFEFCSLILDFFRLYNYLPSGFVRDRLTPVFEIKGSRMLLTRKESGLPIFDQLMLIKLRNLHESALNRAELAYCRNWVFHSESIDLWDGKAREGMKGDKITLRYALYGREIFSHLDFEAFDNPLDWWDDAIDRANQIC